MSKCMARDVSIRTSVRRKFVQYANCPGGHTWTKRIYPKTRVVMETFHMKFLIQFHLSLLRHVTWPFVRCDRCRSGHGYNYIFYNVPRVNVHTHQMKSCTVCHVSIGTRVKWKFLQCPRCPYSQVYEEVLCTSPRVNMDTGKMKICTVCYVFNCTGVRWKFGQYTTCQFGHVSDENLYRVATRHDGHELYWNMNWNPGQYEPVKNKLFVRCAPWQYGYLWDENWCCAHGSIWTHVRRNVLQYEHLHKIDMYLIKNFETLDFSLCTIVEYRFPNMPLLNLKTR